MTALPTRKLEAFRYADTEALAEVWTSLGTPERVEIAAQQKLQQIWLPSGQMIDIRRVEMTVGAGGSVQVFALNTAARYGRIELDVTLHDGADFSFDAAMIGGGQSTLEIVTTVRHSEPNATSRQTVRSVLGGKAMGSYLGKVAVARDAQRTDSEQSVKAMLLDRGATANAKPELEIYADDVKCAHGATVGELDANQLFYAAARGLPPATAKALLLEGFIGGLWDALGEDSEISVRAREALREVAR
ncbi:SufD family Fe-S cluster assembly protein [Sphingomonas sp. HDW15A]|uniref:SufD family Fe-S cluster assembly protein n=1 Tax=Sphingomonas sp. HDW15A TaxID=2714942 RepID=UPI0014088A58|nr:SufD family Fe-S cluster assembly protein [Sphingomonas sp. HDW15A]QIK96869.1 SufD family Fe-S cluster assembly protein [Sphingomonas sp. HDW15A]